MAQHNEIQFETELCAYLQDHGWLYSPNDDGFDRQRALFPADVFAWLEETQPDDLAKRIKPGMSPDAVTKVKDGILTRLAKVLDTGQPSGGTLHVLRNGFKDTPASFAMMQRRPELAGNTTTEKRYAANRVRVMRQVYYSTNNANSIDLVLFVNGIPVATAELKTDFVQSIQKAKQQYMTDRKPAGEPLLGFGTRALVHFAVSNDEVWMTTKLEEGKTRFLPFNRGNHGHAGNAEDPSGTTSPTAYLWQEVWQRDRWLDILGKFMHYETVTSKNPATGQMKTSHTLIFPRHHQLDAVNRLLDDVRATGPGQRYLIQHSAGSGKTRTIAWSAHRLATLHRPDNTKVFDSVIVVTDRNVLDAQLQEAVKQIEAQPGFVATINAHEAAKKSFGSKSKYLTDVLASGKNIIVVTIQTFPFVLEAIQENKALQGKSFAVIADEAHSSQTGQAAAKLKQVLTSQEASDLDDGGEVDIEAVLAAGAKEKADTHNISFFAFTATPKSKTMELFGTPDDEGKPRPFHTYTMQQAIEEEFILDVLKNYTTYATAFQLAQNVADGQMDPVAKLDGTGDLVDESAATKGLMRWVKLHPTNIAQKVAIIVDHFDTQVKHRLGGTAKAMVVTDSRKAAVRYKQAIDAYIAKHNLSEATALVAFSGEVEFHAEDLEGYEDDPITVGDTFTESSMNPGVKDLRSAFDTPEYRVMIVANKFQTGFDQPKLCAMYVDKQLSGVAAVQTLSRLNRFVPGKVTSVLDFVNDPDDILAAFKPYFEEASLVATTDPNLIHDIGNKLDVAGHYTSDEIDAVVTAHVLNKGNNALAGALAPVKHRFIAAYASAKASSDKGKLDELDMFRKDVGTYVRLYDFLSQVLDFGDTDVEKHAIFFRYLASQIRIQDRSPEVDLSEVALVNIKQKELGEHSLDLTDGEVVPLLPTSAAGSKKAHDPRLKLMQEIIAQLNQQFAGENFREDQEVTWVEALVAAMRTDSDLAEQAEANSEAQFLTSPTLKDAVLLAVAETDAAHSRMTELFHEKGHVEKALVELLGRLLYLELHAQEASSEEPVAAASGVVSVSDQGEPSPLPGDVKVAAEGPYPTPDGDALREGDRVYSRPMAKHLILGTGVGIVDVFFMVEGEIWVELHHEADPSSTTSVPLADVQRLV